MEKFLFSDLNLSQETLKAVADMGFEEATPIQSLAIPEIMKGLDIIGQAHTGTGKTGAFGLPMIEMMDANNLNVQFLVLAPTRELAVQIAEEIKSFAKYKRHISILPVYGGQPIERQIYGLKKGAQIVIGTPGRVIDHIDRGTLKLNNIKMVVLDEADEMLNMGFIEDIEQILQHVPSERQTVFFSATASSQFISLTKRYQKDPKFLRVDYENKLAVPKIKQYYYEVKEADKLELLSRIIDINDTKLSMIFCNTKKKVDEVVANLQARGYFADAIHGDMTQSKRDQVMNKFRNNAIEILVATDVAARGLDIDDVEAVFNYDVPQDQEYYVHRIGRTGRAGKSGCSYTFVAGRDVYKLRDIQRYAKMDIERSKIPARKDVEGAKVTKFFEKVKKVLTDTEGLEKYINMVEHLMAQDYSSLEVSGALLKILLHKKLESIKDIDENLSSSFERGSTSFTGDKSKLTKLFINIGRQNKITALDLIGSIATETGVNRKSIGKVAIFDFFSFVEVPNESVKDVMRLMKNKSIKDCRIRVDLAKKKY